MKKITVILLVALLVLSLGACNAQEETSDSIEQYAAPDYTVKINTGTITFEEGPAETAIVSAYSGLSTTHTVVIPDTLAEREVTGIGKGAFYQLSAVRKVLIPDTVTYIGEFAFAGCTSLETITIPASVTYIDAYAFQGCTSLKTVIFEGNVLESIGDYAFLGCTELKTIVLPEGLKSIGNWSFGNCAKITSLEMPSTLEKIGSLTFSGCEGLNQAGALVLSDSIVEIGEFAFTSIRRDYITVPEDCPAADYVENMEKPEDAEDDNFDPDYMYRTENGILLFETDEETAQITITGYVSGSTASHSVTVPEKIGENTVVAISSSAFCQKATVKEIILPDTITSIGRGAFIGCIALETINIPATIETIGELAFSGCSSLKSIALNDSKITVVTDLTFYGCTALESIELPEGLVAIGTMAFGECESLNAIEIPATVTTLGELVFYKCPANDKG